MGLYFIYKLYIQYSIFYTQWPLWHCLKRANGDANTTHHVGKKAYLRMSRLLHTVGTDIWRSPRTAQRGVDNVGGSEGEGDKKEVGRCTEEAGKPGGVRRNKVGRREMEEEGNGHYIYPARWAWWDGRLTHGHSE